MAQSQDDLDQDMPPFEICSLQGSVLESVNAVPLHLRGPLLWEDIFHLEIKEEETDEDEDPHRQEAVERRGKILRSLVWFCDKTEVEGSSSGGDEFRPYGIEEALTCLHREGSFDLKDPGAVARCLHVAGVISLNCLLLLMSTYSQNKDAAAVADHSDLTNELSIKTTDKWKWIGDSWKHMINAWIRYVAECADPEEAMRLLYQWTLLPLLAVLFRVERVMDGANDRDDNQYTEVNHVCKRSDEIWNFLKEYRRLFIASNVTEFLYSNHIYKFLRSTAVLHSRMGNKKHTTELLEEIKSILEGVSDDNLMIPELEKGRISYVYPNHVMTIDHKIDVMTYLSSQLEDIKDDDHIMSIKEELQSCRDIRIELGNRPRGCDFFDWSATLYQDQIYSVFSAFGRERISEAREIFKHMDLNDNQLKASFRTSLFSADTEGLIRHSCSGLTSKWETLREKQEFLLDVCEALGDRQLTAKCLQCCGWMMLMHSVDIFGNFKHAGTLKLGLKVELNLQLTLPAPECVQELLSCLNDPCISDEHKRDNYPDTLKGLRLLKRTIDIYSYLLHNWTQSTSNEEDWLKLLESQKGAHNMMLAFHHCLAFLCKQCTIMSINNPLVDRIRRHSLLCGGNSANVDSVLSSASSALYNSTLVWTERSRARTLLHQLGCGEGQYPDSLKMELIEFDNDQQAAVSSIKSCRSACKGDTMFVQYVSRITLPSFVRNQVDQIFIIHRHGTVISEINTCYEVEKLIDDYYQILDEFHEKSLPRRLEAGDVEKLHRILENLYDILIGPILKSPALRRLHPNAMFVFVPDKVLYRVPFALLRDKITQKYIFQLHPIAISPSFRVLQHCERRARNLGTFPLKPDGCILAVGNASYEKNRMLAGTEKELKHLRSCFPGRVKTIEKDEATRVKFLELVKEASRSKEQHIFACIHLGVHGHWSKIESRDADEGKKQYTTGALEFSKLPNHCTGESKGPSNIIDASRIGVVGTAQCHISVQMEDNFTSKAAISSNGEKHGSFFGEIGALTRAADLEITTAKNVLPSEDIIKGGFQWRTPLVVLSACNSSRGQDYNDGEINLPRALMIAGVPAAVVSQWKIGDSASEMLMKAFYEYLQCGQDVVTALQSAMLLLFDPESESVDQIFDWGPFLVWGLPTVQLPKELWTKNARMIFPVREQSELLRCMLTDILQDNVRVKLFDELKTVDNLLASASSNECALGEGTITKAIIGIEELLSTLSDERHFSKTVVALAQEFYTVILDLKQFKTVELELKKRSTDKFMITFWHHIRYMQVVKGRYEIALEYDRKISEVLFAYDADKTQLSCHLITKAVILTLMGKYTEALKEFDIFYMKCGENFEYLIQMEHLMDLMEEKTGILEYARRVKESKGDPAIECPRAGDFKLGFKTLPDKHRKKYFLEGYYFPAPCIATTCAQCTPRKDGRHDSEPAHS